MRQLRHGLWVLLDVGVEMAGQDVRVPGLVLDLLLVLKVVLLGRDLVLGLAVGVLLVLGGALSLERNVGLALVGGADVVRTVGGRRVVGGDAADGVGKIVGILQESISIRRR